MAVETGYPAQTNVLFPLGIVDKFERNVETAFNPGRLVIKGTTDWDAKPADCLKRPIGWSGYEQINIVDRPLTISTAYATSTTVPIVNCPGKPVFAPAGLARGFVAEEGDLLVPWGAAGQVAAAREFGGKIGIKIPFVKATSEADTNIDLPAGIGIVGGLIEVTTAAAGTIDVGILSSEAGGDADGFLDGVSCAALGFPVHNTVDAIVGSITFGVLLEEVEIKDATDTPVFYGIPTRYVTDGTAKSISYTTSNHTIAGNIYLFIDSPGVIPVGVAKSSVDASAAAANIMIGSLI